MIDARNDPHVSLETLRLDRELSGEADPTVLLTLEQLHGIYSELPQLAPRWSATPVETTDGTVHWHGMTLRAA